MPHRTLTAIFFYLSIAVGALSGCDVQRSQPAIQPDQPEPAQGQTVPALHLMTPESGSDNDDRLRELIQSLNELNPSLQISLTLSSSYESDLAAELASPRPPDVFLATASQLPQLAAQGRIRPIPDAWIERSQLLRAVAEAIEVSSQPYCLPHSVHTTALLYNVDLFRQAGVEQPSAGWTWQDFTAAAIALTDEETGSTGLVLDPSPTTWIPFYLQAGGDMIFDDQGEAVFAPDAAKTASEMIARLFADGVAVAPSNRGSAWAGEAFARGNVGMTIAGDWIVPYLQENPPAFAYAVAELPQGPHGPANVAYANCLAVHAESAHPDLAIQLAAQLTAPEVLTTWTNGDNDALSVYLQGDLVQNASRSHLDPYLRALRYAAPWRYSSFAAQYGELFSDGLALVSAGELSPDEFWSHLLRGGVQPAPP